MKSNTSEAHIAKTNAASVFKDFADVAESDFENDNHVIYQGQRIKCYDEYLEIYSQLEQVFSRRLEGNVDVYQNGKKVLTMAKDCVSADMHENFEVVDHISPKHYKDYCDGLEWIETQQYTSKDFQAAILMQIDKYLARLGGKDEELQELRKAKWYLDFLVAWKMEGKPIRTKDVEDILRREHGNFR